MNDAELNKIAQEIRETEAKMRDAKLKRDTLAAEYNTHFELRKKAPLDGLDAPFLFDPE